MFVLTLHFSPIYAASLEQENSSIIRSNTTLAKEVEEISSGKITKDWSYYGKEEVERYQIQQEYKVKSQDIFSLREAKIAIINGDLELARFFLSKINTSRSDLTLVKNRYLSIVYFIEGDYQSSYDLISSNQYNLSRYYKQICLLRIINLIALDKVDKFKAEMGGCQNATIENANYNHFWLKQVSRVEERDKQLLKGDLINQLRESVSDNNYIALWMKLALFINKEEVIVRRVASLPPSAYNSKEIRELIGFAYYRVGDLEKAGKFIEDIETPNTDNIRGNINLSQNKLELAFGHFKLALKKKQNSLNALERGIPLSYLLGQWDEGLNMLKRTVDVKDERKKEALETALNIRKGNIKEARALLNILEYKFKNTLPYELILMDTFVSLQEGNQERLKNSTAEGCRKQDGVHCWLNLKILEWSNIGKTLKRDEPTMSEEFDLDSLKAKAEITPLQDSIMIDQRDIEELDSASVNVKY